MFPLDNKQVPLLALPKAASVAAAGTLQSAWFDTGGSESILCVVGIDAGAGTPALSFQQATDNAGTGAKALSGWGIGTYDATNKNIMVNNDPALLDVANKFRYVQATVTITGGAGTLTSLNVHGARPREAF